MEILFLIFFFCKFLLTYYIYIYIYMLYFFIKVSCAAHGFATNDLSFSWNLNLQPFNAHSWCTLWKFQFGWKYVSFESLLFVILVVYQRVQITHESFWYLNLKSLFELSTALEVRNNNHKINIGIHSHIWIFKLPCMHCRAPTCISHF